MWRWLDYLLPKYLKAVGRLLVLPPNLRVDCKRFRPDARLERFAERLRPLERIDDRDDGMPYTYDLEDKFGNIRLRCKPCINQEDAFSRQCNCQGIGYSHTLLNLCQATLAC